MRKIFVITLLGSLLWNCEQNIQNTNLKDDVQCKYDSSYYDSSIKEYSFFFNDKMIGVYQGGGDTTEVKKFYKKSPGNYQKSEYLVLINGKIDFNHSMFVDFKKVNNSIKFQSHTTGPSGQLPAKVEFILKNDTLSFEGNRAAIELKNLEFLKAINEVFIEENDDKKNPTYYIISYPYSYNDILNNRTLYNQYLELKKCGLK